MIAFASGCTKAQPDITAPATAAVTAKGIPNGVVVTKTIGASGGTLSSADGHISVVIPEGALAANEEIGIQPVSRQLVYGYGKTYRLTPHGIHFLKPVTIRLRYDEDSIRNTVPELLGIAYQDQSGKWYHTAEPVLDKVNHTLSVNTTHFSDWGFFPYFYIEPAEAVIDPGAQLNLKVMATVPEWDFDNPSVDGNPLLQPFEPSDSYFGDWNYAGEGSLEGHGNRAAYHAANSVPKINPEAVSVPVKMKQKGQFLLVSNITIRSDFHIHYMQVDETEMNTGGLNYRSRLWMYGSFGEDPGKGKRNVKINNGEVTVALWTPAMIACDIPAVGPSSSGMVEVTSGSKTTSKMLNEWVVDLYYDQKQSPDGALTKKVNLVLHLRGDADGFFPQGQTPMVSQTDLHTYCKGVIDMPAASFTNHVSVYACGDYKVQWDAIHNLVIDRKKDNEAGGLRGRVVNQPDGFDIKLDFIAEDALMTHRQFVACNTGSTLDHVKESIRIEGFNNVVIPLRFSKSGSNASIKSGQMPVRTGSPAAGLYWDAQDYNPSQFTINLHWNETSPKF